MTCFPLFVFNLHVALDKGALTVPPRQCLQRREGRVLRRQWKVRDVFLSSCVVVGAPVLLFVRT